MASELGMLCRDKRAAADLPLEKEEKHMPQLGQFMFATGIENSYPTINDGRTRVDQMEKCGHYEHWKLDFQRVDELGMLSPTEN